MSCRKLLKGVSLITSVLILLCIPLAGCIDELVAGDTSKPLAVNIHSPEGGACFSVNVQKVIGVVSDPEATVHVNGIEAAVSQDGSFYAYIDLIEGENVIEAEAVWGKATVSDAVTVNFTPALAVILDIEYESGVNYLTTPLTVLGFVTHPEATVTVDGNPVAVSADGSFTTEVQLTVDHHSITAVAKLNGVEDSYSYLILVSSEGYLDPVPGWSSFYIGRTIYENKIQLEASEVKSFDVKKEINKNVMVPTDFNWEVYAVDNDSIPEGLKVSIEPAAFIVYPNTTYILPLTVSAASNVEAGTYFFKLESHGDVHSSGWIEIVIE
jgi:uncharacterized Zn-binding protein involved in type VI secretion